MVYPKVCLEFRNVVRSTFRTGYEASWGLWHMSISDYKENISYSVPELVA